MIRVLRNVRIALSEELACYISRDVSRRVMRSYKNILSGGFFFSFVTCFAYKHTGEQPDSYYSYYRARYRARMLNIIMEYKTPYALKVTI